MCESDEWRNRAREGRVREGRVREREREREIDRETGNVLVTPLFN